MKTFLSLVIAAFFAADAYCGESVLDRVPELQKKASLATSGALGCGIVSDAIKVFGNPIKTSDLLTLLKSRAESNQSGKTGPMSGKVSNLCYVCLEALSHSKDLDVISPIADLLTDKDDVICGWAAIALYRLGSASEELRKKIEVIPFPGAATASAGARGEQAPSWVTRAK